MRIGLFALSLASLPCAVLTTAQADSQNSGLSVTKEIAQAVIAHRLAMRPLTDFEKWQTDVWGMHAVDCARAAGLEVPKEVAQARFLKSGSWSAPANTAATCSELASGPDAICFNLNSHEAPFGMPWGGLPRNYAFLAKPLTSGTSVVVGGWCQLVRNKQHTQQFYAGQAKANWLIPPTLQQMNTAQGVVMLNFGTVEFISTAPGRHIVLAVVR